MAETWESVKKDAREALVDALTYQDRVIDKRDDHELIVDAIHETADSQVPIYTSDRFSVLADPHVYTQDISELGYSAGDSDLEQAAGIAIYMAIEESLWGSLDDILDAVNEQAIPQRLEYLRSQLKAECISYYELAELQSLVEYIEPGDVELLEAAGVPEEEVK